MDTLIGADAGAIGRSSPDSTKLYRGTGYSLALGTGTLGMRLEKAGVAGMITSRTKLSGFPNPFAPNGGRGGGGGRGGRGSRRAARARVAAADRAASVPAAVAVDSAAARRGTRRLGHDRDLRDVQHDARRRSR